MSKRGLAQLIGNLLSPSGRRGRLAVFCYHQVLEVSDAYRRGEPTATEFKQDVATLDSVFTLLPFGEAVTRLASSTLPARAACITFDDGYENNLSLAAPILEQAGVPATFFVTGGAVDDGVMWNDLVIESVANSGSAEQARKLAVTLGELKYRPMGERWDAAVQMYQNTVGSDLPRLMMTRDMVAELSASGFEIGGHTINHPILKELSDDDARQEIEDCATWIQDVTGNAPTSFAYPNGVPGQDYTSRHERMVRDAGFEAAASTHWAFARRGTDPLSIPRVGPWWRQGRTLTGGLSRSYLKSYLAR